MTKVYNQEMNVAKAIGIISIVAMHVGWIIPLGPFFHSDSWMVPIFFFISGYFFKIDRSIFDVIKRAVCKYLGIFYTYHFFYCFATIAVFYIFHKLYAKNLPTIKDFFFPPIDIPLSFSASNWFLMQLAISLVLFAIIMFAVRKISKNVWFSSAIFLIFGILAICLAKPDFAISTGGMRILIRTLISMFYIYVGWLYKYKLEEKIQYNTKWLISVFVAQIIIIIIICNNCYIMDLHRAALFHNASALLVPFTAIYVVLFISKLLAPLVKEGSLIDKIGKNSLHIMANHIFIMYLVMVILFLIEGKSAADFMTIDLYIKSYKVEKYRYLYAFFGIMGGTYIGELVNFIKIKLTKKFNKTV